MAFVGDNEAMFYQVRIPECQEYAAILANKFHFGTDPAKSLTRNFSVDDLLKSTPDAQSAIKSVTEMCKAGRFKLGKFISNNTEVFKPVQENQRKDAVKDLSSGELSIERALGIQQNMTKTNLA